MSLGLQQRLRLPSNLQLNDPGRGGVGPTPPFTPTVYLEDNFNNTTGANVNLSGWIPDTVGNVAWTQNAGSAAGNAQVAFATDTVVWTSATPSVYQDKTIIPDANYKITATLGDNPATFSAPGIMLGVLDTAITGYLVYHDGQSALGISVQRGVAGAFTPFYGTTQTMPDGVAWGTTPHVVSVSRYVMPFKVRLKITDVTRGYTCIIDDTSGSRLTATAYPGIRGRQTATIDAIKVESIPPQNQGGTELVADGCRSWFVMADTICFGGDTYTGYVTSTGAIGISRLRLGVLSQSTANVGIGEVDDHDNPAPYAILPSGQMILLYSRHSTVDTFIRYRITTLPLASITTWDSSIWGPEQQISTGGLTCSYPKPFVFAGDGTFYVAYRAGSGTQRDQVVASTTIASLLAGTPTWTLTTILQVTSQRPYVQMKMNAAGDKLFHSTTNGHPAEVSTSIYGGYFALVGGALKGYDLAGNNTALPLQVASNLTLIQDTTGGTNWNMDLAVGADGNPRFLVSRYPTDPFTNTNVFLTDIQYWFYRWSGSAVSGFQLASGQHSIYPTQSPYCGNACLDGNYDGTSNTGMFSAEWDATDLVYKLAAYSINEGTQARTKTRDISIDPSSHQWRPSSPVGHGSDYALSWIDGGYSLYIAFNTTMRMAAA